MSRGNRDEGDAMNTQFGSGIASGDDGRAVGRAAASEAREAIDADRVDFCQVFASAQYDYEAVIAGVREVCGAEATLLGCSSAGEFTETDTREGSVAVAVVTSDTLSVTTGLGTGLSENVTGCVREAMRGLSMDDEYPHRAAVTLHDGLAGVGEQLSLVAGRKLGQDVSLAGGSAGDDMRMESTHVFADDEIVRDAMAVGQIAAERPPVVTANHGHEPISDQLEVTSAEGNVVHELDGEPAFEVWKEIVREQAREELGIDVDDIEPESDRLTEVLARYEFGIDQGDGYKIRWPGVTPTTDGPLEFALTIPEGTVLRVMHGPKDDQIEAVRTAAREAIEEAEAVGTDVAGAFVYDCACRATILGPEFSKAVDAMAAELDVPFVGFETYGEICMERGETSGYHNTTAVILLVPK
jgi:methyl-accepting chemotaxis protein